MTKQTNENDSSSSGTIVSKIADKMTTTSNSNDQEHECAALDRFHIAARIEKGVQERAKTSTRNCSSEVLPLERKYSTLKSNLNVLKKAVHEYYSNLEKTTELRHNVATTLGVMATGSPIQNTITGADAESPAAILKESLTSVESDASAASKEDLKDLEKVHEFVTEWEAIVTDKVEGEIQEVNHLHKRVNHYQDKVDKLRGKEEKVEEKVVKPDGSLPKHPISTRNGIVLSPEKLKIKLERNEKKLDKAWKQHKDRAASLCNLLEEVTGHGWHLLHHLVRLVIKFESTYASHLDAHLSKLPSIMDEMTEMYHDHNGQQSFSVGVPAVDTYDSDSSTEEESVDNSTDSTNTTPKSPLQKMVDIITPS